MIPINHDLQGKQINYLDNRAYLSTRGSYYPSVTTVLNIIDKGEQYRDWLMSNGYNADYKMIKAQEIGTKVHGLVERFNSNPDDTILCIEYDENGRPRNMYDKRVWEMFSRYVNFYDRFKPELLAVEQIVVSDNYQLGGTIDLVFRLNGLIYLADNKTGENLHNTQRLQLAAYAVMWNEAFPDYKIDKIAILHLNAKTRSDGKAGSIQGRGWQLKEIGGENEYNKLFKVFMNSYDVWRFENPNWRPLVLELPDRFKRGDYDTAREESN
jgi:hypothetical protein